MDLSKIGKFIAERRKAKNLTQVQLAEKICVSEKTISKWECGNGFPDTTLMLPLCDALDITANELLAGKLLSNEEYKMSAEENLIKLAKQDIYKNKLLLSLECVICYMAVLILLACTMVASFVTMPTVWRVLLIVFGFINCLLGFGFALLIEKDAGYYECGKCHKKFIPTFNQVLFSSHFGRTRHIKCPHCKNVSWCKKTIEK